MQHQKGGKRCPATSWTFCSLVSETKTRRISKYLECEKKGPTEVDGELANVGKGKEKIPLQICDIILPTAHIQTKQGYVSGFHLLPPAHPFLFTPSSLSFFLSLEKVGGGRERWQNSRSLEVCPIPALNSAPQLLWFETVRVSVSFCLNHFLPSLSSGPLSLHISYQWPYHCLVSSLPLGGAGKASKGNLPVG